MPIKTFYFKDAVATGSLYGSLQEDGTAPTTATTATGWTVGTTVSNRYSSMYYAGKRSAASFGTTALPNSDPDNTSADAWRSEKPLTGRFRGGYWKIRVPVIASSAGGTQDGNLRICIWKSPSKRCDVAPPDTPSMEERQIGTTIVTTTATNLTTGTPIILAVNQLLDSVRFDGEYLFIQCAWYITGAGSNANCDVLFRVGSDSYVQTPFFEDGDIFYPTNATASLSNFGNAVEGTPPNDELSTTTGWDMFNLPPGGSVSRFKHGTEQTTASFSTSQEYPNAAPDNTIADAIRSANTLNTTFESGSWSLHMSLRAKTNPGAGNNLPEIRYRLWKSPNSDGSSATEITNGYNKIGITGYPATNDPDKPSLYFHSCSINSRVTFSNEYLFLQLANSITGAVNTSGSDGFINYGLDTRISTPNMVIPQPRGHTLDTNTVALWRFNDNTDDEADTAHLTSSAALTPEFVAGVDSNFSSSYAFSGSNYLTNLAAPELSAAFGNSNTIETWVYIDSHTSPYSWPMNLAGSGESYATNIVGGFKIMLTGTIDVHWEYGAGSDSIDYEFTGSHIPLQTWTHIAIVREDLGNGFSNITLWKNAQYMGKYVNARNPQGTCLTWVMGRWTGGGNTFSGRFDDTRISNVARSYAEIYESYTGSPLNGGITIQMNNFWTSFSPGLRKGFW